MSRRSFSLAGLLRVRGIQERAAAEHLSRAAIERSRTQTRERHLRSALGSDAETATDVRTLAALAAGRVASRSALADLVALRKVQDAALAAARAGHDAARLEEQRLVRLAEAHASRERLRAQQAEQAELDEIAIRPRREESS